MDAGAGNEPDVVAAFDLLEVSPVGSGTGKIGGCRTFTSALDHFVVTQTGAFLFTSTFSISCFFKPTKVDSSHPFVTGEDWALGVMFGYLSFEASADSLIAGDVSMETWHHAVVTYNNPNIKLYLDGAEVASSTLQTTNPGQGSLTIGAFTDGELNYEGGLDLLYFFDAELFSADVVALYNGGAGLKYVP